MWLRSPGPLFTRKVVLLVALVLSIAPGSLTGCAQLKSLAGHEPKSSAELPAEVLAKEGLDQFNHGRYHGALETFEKLKELYPFSRYSLLAELKIADSNYYMKRYEESRALYQEFEENHPTNEAIPYVLFQIGMSYFKQIGKVDRDTSGAIEATQSFSRLLRAFPQSPYTEEATVRIKEARNFLAAHELYVADFYLRTGEYDQAKSRLEYLLVNFPDTKSAPKARELVAAIKAGKPPGRSWLSWLPIPGLGRLDPLSFD